MQTNLVRAVDFDGVDGFCGARQNSVCRLFQRQRKVCRAHKIVARSGRYESKAGNERFALFFKLASCKDNAVYNLVYSAVAADGYDCFRTR